MSLSPLKVVNAAQAPRYISAISKFAQLLRAGRSFSGRERNCVYLNTGTSRFADVSHVAGMALPDDARAICATDWDHDGDLDLWYANRTAPRLRLMRNETEGANYLSLLLEGKTCNRDAVGARVRVNDKQIRTVRAGSGFQSQSSRWLHFGMRRKAGAANVAVQWPDGSEDVFTDLPTGHHYRLVQGGKPKAWTRPQPATAPTPSPPTPPKPTDAARVMLWSRVPMIRTRITTFDGKAAEVGAIAGQATLLNLWASWCAPCIGELKALNAGQSAIEAAGLRVIAASVDGLDTNHATNADDAQQIVEQLGLTFDTGMLDKDTVQRLEFFQNMHFVRNAPMPVPTSFLIDGHGRLAAIYRGPLQVDQLLADVRTILAADPASPTGELPLPGRWLLPQPQYDVAYMILRLHKQGLVGDAVKMFQDYTRLAVAQTGEAPTSPTYGRVLHNMGVVMRDADQIDLAEDLFRRAAQLLPQDSQPLYQLANVLIQTQRHQQAITVLLRLARFEPTEPQWPLQLALIYEVLGQTRQAVKQLDLALKLDPYSPQTLYRLARLIATRQSEELPPPGRAVALAEQLVAIVTPKQAPPYDVLAMAYARDGQFEKAIEAANEAAELARTAGNQNLADAITLRLQRYRANQPYLEQSP